MSTVNFNDTTPAAAAWTTNVKFQSDANGNISAYTPSPPWTDYTPTVAAIAPMTVVLNSVSYARGQVLDGNATVDMELVLTTSGTASSALYVSLPWVAVNNQRYLAGYMYSFGAFLPLVVQPGAPSGAALTAILQGGGNFPIESNLVFAFSGIYRVV